MSHIHQLITQHGLSAVRRMVSAEDRRLVDIAAEFMANESTALGITYAGFCLTSLPHKALPDEQHWERTGHRVQMIVQPGLLPDNAGGTKLYGVPYGSRARMILLYLQTRAVQTGSPEVELGSSMREWLGRMNVSIGGKQYRDVKEQANRISACNLTFVWEEAGGKTRFAKDSIVKGGIQLYDGDDNQPRLWVDTVKLSDSFFSALCDHPVPVSEAAICAISGLSMALDVYIWLAYRLHVLERATPVTWVALHKQFGFGYQAVRQFKPRFIDTLRVVLQVYPEAHVDIDDTGITLHPSHPPIRERKLTAIGR